jgi:hypothetical protein
MTKSPMMMSERARLAIKMLVTFSMRRVVITIHMSRKFPTTAKTETEQYKTKRRAVAPVDTS